MIYVDEKRIEEILDSWPLIRRSLSEIVSSRRLEKVDEMIDELWNVITPVEEE